jgi:hypothetical protein
MKILLLGATGDTGAGGSRKPLEQSHTFTVLNPERMACANGETRVITGGVTHDTRRLRPSSGGIRDQHAERGEFIEVWRTHRP